MRRCRDCDVELGELAAYCPKCGSAVLDLPSIGGAETHAAAEPGPMVTQVGMPIPQSLLPTSLRESSGSRGPEAEEAPEPSAYTGFEPSDSERATIVQMPGMVDEEPSHVPAEDPVSPASPSEASAREVSGADASPGHLGELHSSESAWSLDAPKEDSLNEARPVEEPTSSHGLNEPLAPPLREVHPGRRMLLLGVSLTVLGVVGSAVSLVSGGGPPLSFGQPEATVTKGLLDVRLPVRSERRICISHPGGQTDVEGEKTVRFSLPAKKPKFESKALKVSARDGDTDIPVEVVVEPVYRLRTISVTDARLEVQLTHRFGWKASVKPGQLHRIDSTSFRWVLNLGQPNLRGRSQIAASLSLVDLKGKIRLFEEVLNVPSVVTPLTLLTPSAHLRTSESSVLITGITLPGAKVTVEKKSTIADVDGRFEIKAPLIQMGGRTLTVTSKAEGREPVAYQVSVTRHSRGERRKEIESLRTKYGEQRVGLDLQPAYGELGQLDPGRRFLLEGRLAALERIDESTSLAVISLCETGRQCPVLAHVSGPTLAEVGQRVRGIGRSLGLRRYRSRDNHTRNVPRLEVEYIVQ
mgnify:CR=1 FL=1